MSEQLPHDDELGALYRQLPADEPGAALDAAILDAARRRMHEDTRRRFLTRLRWSVPLAAAAGVVLTLSLTRLTPNENCVTCARPIVAPSGRIAPTEGRLTSPGETVDARGGRLAKPIGQAKPIDEAKPIDDAKPTDDAKPQALAASKNEKAKPPVSVRDEGKAEFEHPMAAAAPLPTAAPPPAASAPPPAAASGLAAPLSQPKKDAAPSRVDADQLAAHEAPAAPPSIGAQAWAKRSALAERDALTTPPAVGAEASAVAKARQFGSSAATAGDRRADKNAVAAMDRRDDSKEFAAMAEPEAGKTDDSGPWPFKLEAGLGAEEACRRLTAALHVVCSFRGDVAVVFVSPPATIDAGRFEGKTASRVTLTLRDDKLWNIALQIGGLTGDQVLMPQPTGE